MLPKYFKLKEKINEEILKGTYPLLSKLPTEVELAQSYGCSRATVRSALALLEEEGIIAKKWGSGNIVMKNDLGLKKNVVAVVVADKSAAGTSAFISDLASSLYKEKLELDIMETGSSSAAEAAALEKLLRESYAGAVITPVAACLPSVNTALYQKLIRRQTPLVFLEALPYGIAGQSLVKPDNYDCGYQNARFLINRSAGHIGGIFLRDSAASIERYSGFVAALSDAAVAVDEEYFLWCNAHDCPSHLSRGSAAINKFLKVAAEAGALVYCDDASIPAFAGQASGGGAGAGTPKATNKEFVFFNKLTPARSLGKAAATALLTIKKGGTAAGTTINVQ